MSAVQIKYHQDIPKSFGVQPQLDPSSNPIAAQHHAAGDTLGLSSRGMDTLSWDLSQHSWRYQSNVCYLRAGHMYHMAIDALCLIDVTGW